MKIKLFKLTFSLFLLFFTISCKPVSEFLEPINYIEEIKKKEVISPNYNNNTETNLETLIYDFFKNYYDDITKSDIVWEEKAEMDNGKLIRASYKGAYVDIKAIKDNKIINIEVDKLEFKDIYGNKYNITNLPIKKLKENSTVEPPVTIPPIKEETKVEEIKESPKNSKENYTYGEVIDGRYKGTDFIQAVKNANSIETYEDLKEKFYLLMEDMYVTKDKITYYYLYDIVSKLAEKANANIPVRDDLRVEGKKMYYVVLFPKDYTANTPYWVEFEIFQKRFDDGIELRTAHVRCAIDNVEYKDWEAIAAIYR
jgi:hypothetical protein